VAAAGLVFIGIVAGFLAGTLLDQGSIKRTPFAIVNANSMANAPDGSARDPKQILQTVGRLHADILSLQLLYRRLAEETGLELSDFELSNEVLMPGESQDEPTEIKAEEVDDVLGQLSEQVESLNASAVPLGKWYGLRSLQNTFNPSGFVIMRGRFSSGFGFRENPRTGEMKMHKGVDFSGRVGEPILALADGVVSYSGKMSDYGYMVELMHANGMRTRYAHNDSNVVRLGERVEQGQIVAKLGSTGRSTGPHVHVEVHLNGEPVDPKLFIQ